MKRATLLLSVLALAPAWFSAPTARARGTEPTQLRVEPLEGHPGDTIYLSGSGFTPNTELTITMACPNVGSSLAYQGNEKFWGKGQGPYTNGQGTFVGYKIKTWKLSTLPMQCEIYANNGPSPFGVDIPSVFYERSPGDQLSRSARHIPVAVTAHPQRVRGGYSENIQLSGWPGAGATVSLRYPGEPVQKRTVQLNFAGKAGVQWPVGHVSRNQTAHVTAVVRLGRASGSGSTKFLILH